MFVPALIMMVLFINHDTVKNSSIAKSQIKLATLYEAIYIVTYTIKKFLLLFSCSTATVAASLKHVAVIGPGSCYG